MKTMGSDGFAAQTRGTEEATLITQIAEELIRAGSDLYSDRKVPSNQDVTLAHLSFTNYDIFIAIPNRGVTFVSMGVAYKRLDVGDQRQRCYREAGGGADLGSSKGPPVADIAKSGETYQQHRPCRA